MTETELLNAVAQAIRAEAERTQDLAIHAHTRLVEELGLDSIDLVGITMRLEDRFHIDIDVQEVKNFRCVSDVMTQVSRLLAKTAA